MQSPIRHLALVATCLSLSACAPATSLDQPPLGQVAEVDAQNQEPESGKAKSETLLATKAAQFPPLSEIGARKAGEDWPLFLGPAQTSKSTETGYKPAESPKVLWRKRFGEGYSIGAVARGRYFQFYRNRDDIVLECLNAETGASRWTYKYPTTYSDPYGYNGGPRSSPVIDAKADLAFIYGPDGMLVALRASTGDEIWKIDTRVDYSVVQNFFGVGSAPLIDGEKLIVIVGGTKLEPEESFDFMEQIPNGSAIVAFDKRTGKELYRSGKELASYASPIIANVKGERRGFAFLRGGLLGFDPETGKTQFHFPWRAKIMESVNAATPLVDNAKVLITECYGPGSAFLDVSGVDPKVIWQDDPKKREKSLKAHWNTPVLHEGYVYASSGRHQGDAELRCIELATGKVKWTQPELGRCSLLYVDGHFLCQCEEGSILVLKANPEKYDLVCELKLPDRLKPPAWSAPILSHGLAYFRDEHWTVCVELIPQ